MNKVERIGNFVRTLSTDRFDRYLGLTDGNTDKALCLYACNACLSQALYVPLQALEVTLRNSIHECLKTDMGEYWFDKPDLIVISHQFGQIGEAKAKLVQDRKSVLSPRVVAALPFGFWTTMFNSDYEELWRHHLCGIVLPEKREGITRKTFSGPLKLIRKIRNRIAHHECIIELDLNNHYGQIKHLTGLLSPEARYWLEQNSIFETVYGKEKALLDNIHGRKKSDARADTGT